MSALAMACMPLALPFTLRLPRCLVPQRTELRIDVQLPEGRMDADLERLDRRLRTPGDSLHGLPLLPVQLPGFTFRHRVADGEHYVYVEDVARQCLAGFTVFNRLVELDRRADRVLRGPHSKYAAPYQRRGIAGAVYGWALETGMCLVSGPRQSPGAHALWMAMARRFEMGYVALRDKELRHLGTDVAPSVVEDFHTRMVLLGEGWSLEGLLRAAGAAGP